MDGQEGEITMAAPSTADAMQGTWTTYQYGVNNFGLSSVSPSQGEYDTTITYDHALITTQDDIQFNILWDDMATTTVCVPSRSGWCCTRTASP